MSLSHATRLGRLQAGGRDGDDPASWSAITAYGRCRALSGTRAAGCDGGGGDLPGSHALVTGTHAEPANCCGRGRAVPASKDQYSSWSLCPHFPSTLLPSSDSILHG